MFLEVAEIYVITLYELLFRDFRKNLLQPLKPLAVGGISQEKAEIRSAFTQKEPDDLLTGSGKILHDVPMERSDITDDGFFVFQDFLLQFSAADGIADCDETVHAAADKIPDSLEIFLFAVAERYKIGAVSSQFQLVQQPDDHCLNVFFQGDPVHSEQDSDGPCLVSPEELVPEILLVNRVRWQERIHADGFLRN